jgi:hypothetical protein
MTETETPATTDAGALADVYFDAWGCAIGVFANGKSRKLSPAEILESFRKSALREMRGDEPARAPKVRTNHHRNKEEAARLQALVDERYAASQQSPRLEREAVEKALCCPKGCVREGDCFVSSPGAAVRYTRTKREREQADAILALLSPDSTVVSSASRCDPSQHGRHIPQTSPAPGDDSRSHSDAPMREALEKAREEIVLAVAFLGRDVGTERQGQTIHQLIARLVAADKAAIVALTPVTSKNRGAE